MTTDNFNPPNSVWPNGLKRDEEGYVTFYPLGTNKVDISTITWPEGDKLVSPFVYQNDKLVGFVDTKALTVSGSAATTMNYSHIEADFASISEGKLTVNAPNATVKKFSWAVSTGGDETFDFVIIDFNTTDQETIDTVRTAKRVVDNKLYDANDGLIGTIDTSKIEVGGSYDMKADGLFYNGNERALILSDFNSDLSSLRNGSAMFTFCNKLTTFTSDLPSLTNGSGMFEYCFNLESFCGDLSSLTNGNRMFYMSNLSEFSSDLPNLMDGALMFASCYNITSFYSDLPSLTNGEQMFEYCGNLTSFSSDLSSLTNGEYMFTTCSKLTSFNANLPSLTSGNGMFDGCKLDASSVKNIIDRINTYSGLLLLGIGCNNTTEDKNLFAQEVGYADMTFLLAALRAKGWTVTAQYNGRPTTTYSLRKPSENALPIFVKLDEDEKHGNYTSQDCSKKYRLNWFHETTGSTEGYTQFNSIEEAVAHFNIKPIERN